MFNIYEMIISIIHEMDRYDACNDAMQYIHEKYIESKLLAILEEIYYYNPQIYKKFERKMKKWRK